MNTSNTETVTVNEVEIICPLHNDQNYVAIKPICQALGISHSAQWRRIQNDEILNSVVAELATTGSDNKQYKMVCIPVKFVFGWLFSIDISKVKGEAKPIMQKYKLECYETLYDRFYLRAHLYEKKMQMILQKKDQIEALERDMATNRRKLNEEKKNK